MNHCKGNQFTYNFKRYFKTSSYSKNFFNFINSNVNSKSRKITYLSSVYHQTMINLINISSLKTQIVELSVPSSQAIQTFNTDLKRTLEKKLLEIVQFSSPIHILCFLRFLNTGNNIIFN